MLGIFRNLTITIILFCLTFLLAAAPSAFSAFPEDCIEENTYSISTIAELQNITVNLQDAAIDHGNSCYFLMNDIRADETAELNGGLGFLPIGVVYDPANETEPYSTTPFSGYFNGNGFTISGLSINTSGTGQPAGLFGTISAGTISVEIRDLILEDMTLSSDTALGTLAGSLVGSATAGVSLTITGCRVQGALASVTGSGPATGGLVGAITSTTAGSSVMMTDCSNSAAVYGVSQVGGLFGNISINATVSRCLNTGTIIGAGDQVGGIAGHADYAIIRTCINSGAVEGVNVVGGLAGNLEGTCLVDQNFNEATVTASGNYAGGLVGKVSEVVVVAGTPGEAPVLNNNYNTGDVTGSSYVGGFTSLNQGAINKCYSTGKVRASSNFGGFAPDIAENTGLFSQNYWDSSALEIVITDPAGVFPRTDLQLKAMGTFNDGTADADWNFVKIWAIDESNTRPFFRFRGGSGQPDDPYLIRDAYGLQGMNGDEELLSSSFKIITAIDMSDTRLWDEEKGFTPIGSNTPFTGTLAGQGFLISNLYINRPSTGNVGLFSSLGENAVIDHVIIENASVTGSTDCGILAGYSQGSLMNCSVSGKVSGYENTGGLAGSLFQGLVEACNSRADVFGYIYTGGLSGYMTEATAANCHFQGMVNGTGNTGGLTGRCMQSNVSGCSSKASVYGHNVTGGLIGSLDGTSSFITQCASSSHIDGRNNLGGFVGYAKEGSISACLSSGKLKGERFMGGFAGYLTCNIADSMSTVDVEGEDRVGGFAGLLTIQADIERCYSKGTVSGETDLVGGFIGVNGSGIENFESSYWDIESSGMTTSDGGEGLTSAAMMIADSFPLTWDFSSTWGILEGITRPYPLLPMTTTDLGMIGTSPVNGLDNGGNVNVTLTVTNKGGEAIDSIIIRSSFNDGIESARYSLDDGDTWQDLGEEIVLNLRMNIGDETTIQVRGLAHNSGKNDAEAEFSVDFSGIDPDVSDNTAKLTWTFEPNNLGSGDTVYGDDGSGCFIQSAFEL